MFNLKLGLSKWIWIVDKSPCGIARKPLTETTSHRVELFEYFPLREHLLNARTGCTSNSSGEKKVIKASSEDAN